jgi:7-carboxy-7-deazaguanine synthase
MKRYAIKEMFGPTIQGEATMAGLPVLFLRFSGCNMWDGRQETRADSQCPYCDTDFFGGELLTIDEIVSGLQKLRDGSGVEWVWVSGGEPMLQLNVPLAQALTNAGFKLGIETNGTVLIDRTMQQFLSHITVSPKVQWSRLQQRRGDTLKLLYPHPNPLIVPEAYDGFSALHRYLQPIDTGDEEANLVNLQAAIDKVQHMRGWKLSLQTHKYMNVP